MERRKAVCAINSSLPRETIVSQDETALAGSAKYLSASGFPSKPSPTYVALIANVILSSPAKKLNLSSIYRALEESFPQVGSRGPGWRNSVRHNLSVNDCFVKLSRCEDGRGHYWGVHHAHLGHFERGNFKRSQRARGRRARSHQVAQTKPQRICCSLGHQLNFSACIQPWWVGGAKLLGLAMGGAQPLDWTKPSQLRWKMTEWYWKTPATAAGRDEGRLLTPRGHCWDVNPLYLSAVKESHDWWFSSVGCPVCWCVSPVVLEAKKLHI